MSGYSAYSLLIRNCFAILVVLYAGIKCFEIHAQSGESLETYRFDEITVIADQQIRYLENPAASVTVLTRDDIEALNATSIIDVLSVIAPLDIRERGTPGSQADISIRGSSIEGVLLLIDGVRVHDPQTGHYTLDLPVGLASVERIEVLAGGGAGMYGGSAPGGVINIVTASQNESVAATLSGGSFGSSAGQASLSHKWDRSSVLLSFRTGTSDGYRDDTDISYSGINVSGDAASNDWRLKWNLGMLAKSFGAGEFYGDYPSSEKTATYQGGIHLTRLIDKRQLVRLRAGSRGHDDTFTLIRTDPAYYRNLHYNRSTSTAIEYIALLRKSMTMTAGIELERFGITSGTLGMHGDLNSAVYTQLAANINQVTLTGALRYDAGYRDDHVLSPMIGLAYPFTSAITARLRAERSYRPPTYTDLYYDSPANRGNPEVRAEYQTSTEAGLEYTGEKGNISFTAFASEATDVIDWVRTTGETIWMVENHGRLLTGGMEAGIDRSFANGWQIRTQAMALDQKVSRKAGIESKYALNPLDRVLTASLTGPLHNMLSCTLTARYEHQHNGSERIPVSVRFGARMKSILCRLTVENLFDESYDELPGLPAPGRWITIHMEYAR